MLPWVKRLMFPLTIAFVLGVGVWQYRAARAEPLPEATVYRDANVVIRVAQSGETTARTMEPYALRIEIADANGAPIDGAAIRMKTWMPNMFCGVFEASIASGGGGVYEAKVLPVMSGRWQAQTVVEIGGESYKVDHLFNVVK